MKLALNDIVAFRGDIFTDERGHYRRVVAAGERFFVHVPCSRWVEVEK